jgi:ABC-2 type transport system permease protein
MAAPASRRRDRSRPRKAYDTVAAYLRMDIIEERMFPFSSVMRYLVVVIPVLMYYFQADFLDAKDQYATTLVGVSVAAGLLDALTGLTVRLQFAQERGTLETYLVEPVSWRFVPLAMNVWRSFTGIVITMTMMGVGVVLGADVKPIGFVLVVPILVLGILACNAVGIFAASFLILFKRGEPVIALYSVAAAFLGGSLFAIGVLPLWIRWASYLIPHSYVISAARAVLVPGGNGGQMGALASCAALLVFCVVVFWIGLHLFQRTLHFAREAGVLST